MTIKTKPATDEYRDNWDRIFGEKLVERLRDNADIDAAERAPDECGERLYDYASEMRSLRERIRAMAMSACKNKRRNDRLGDDLQRIKETK